MKNIFCRLLPLRIGWLFLLIGLAAPFAGRGAISQGPVTTNEVELQQRQKMLFDQAVLSGQDQLRVGRERYARHQLERSKMIQSLAAQLDARKQLVELQPNSAPAEVAVEEQPTRWLRPTLAMLLLGVIFFCLAFLKRQRDQAAAH